MGFAQAALGYFFRPAPTPPKRIPVDESIYWLVPGILAGRPGPECVPWNVLTLKGTGIGGVVSLDGPIRSRDLLAVGIQHLPLHQPMLLLHSREDHLRFLTVIPRLLSFIDQIKNTNQATLVHCYYGCDRTGAALASYLVAREGHSAESAIHEVQKVNPDAMWAVGYSDAVYTFEELFREHPEVYQ